MKRSAAVLAGVGVSMLLWAGSAQAAYVSPPSQDFGSQSVGSTGAATSFTLSTSANYCHSTDGITCDYSTAYTTDTSALGGDMGATTRSGDFLIHNIDCQYPSYPAPPATIPNTFFPGACHFEVSFAPVAGGARSRTLTFPDTGGASGSLTLTGTGILSGQRAAAIAKCKKKFRKGTSRRKKCLKHARLLPA